MRHRCLLLLLGLLCGGCLLPQGEASRVVETSSVLLDRLTPSYYPKQVQTQFTAVANQPGELIWLRGIQARCVGEKNEKLDDHHLALSTLDLRWPEWHNQKFQIAQSRRLFMLGGGPSEFHLPSGYGIPLHSNEAFWYTARFANSDAYFPAQRVYQSVSLDYVRERGLAAEMKPVLVRVASVVGEDGSLLRLAPGENRIRRNLTPELRLLKKRRLVASTASCYGDPSGVKIYKAGSQDVLVTMDRAKDSDGLAVFTDERGVEFDPAQQYEIELVYESTNDEGVGGAYFLLYFSDVERD